MRRPGRLLLGAIAATVCVYLILPTLIVVPISFTKTDFITFPPQGFSTRWYAAFFTRPEWSGAFVTSLVVATFTAALTTVLGTMIGLALPRLPPRANRLLGLFFLLPMIVPAIITAVALYRPFAQIGLIASVPGLIVAHTILALPFVVINVAAVVHKLDWRIVDAARSLGASPAIAFRKVTLPALAPGIAAGGIFAFLTSFDEVVVALFISGSGATTLPVQMWSGIRFEISPIAAAASCLLLLGSCLLLALFSLLKRT
ncbi:polyamine ABC transporter permease [Prosthecomicrobium hirschii]|uniref:ABC transporter permease n=1 Tax=Prosthecodimorpha hirschii TaxID=665126 RepID=UPI0011275C2B|nr:ABC transporter permease [Prosthecomicrobium hirschii]TPQ49298.1 polyamine ABC transporter permease [Prosthecomicrobium hirschii]